MMVLVLSQSALRGLYVINLYGCTRLYGFTVVHDCTRLEKCKFKMSTCILRLCTCHFALTFGLFSI